MSVQVCLYVPALYIHACACVGERAHVYQEHRGHIHVITRHLPSLAQKHG